MKRAYIIAEAGVNHGGDLRVAFEMVERAAASGVDAFKVQVYDPEKLTTAAAGAYWDTSLEPTQTQRELFQAHTGLTRADHEVLSAVCHDRGLDFIASVFHVEDVEWLARLVDQFKIASGDITHFPLLRAVAETGKPVILSTGASTQTEISKAASLFIPGPTLLHCTLSYPCMASDANLGAVKGMGGYSDHTLPDVSHTAILTAYTLGATVIEKHYTLDKTLPGNDHYHAFDPDDFKQLRRNLDLVCELVGDGVKRVLPVEEKAREGARRSLTSAVDIPADTTITPDMVCYKRPGNGLA